MPIELTDPNNTSTRSLNLDDLRTTDFEYKYPKDLDFHPDSELHKDVLKKIMDYTQESSTDISGRHAEWAKIDTTLTAFVPDSTKQAAKDRGDKTSPVIIPSSYALLETLLAYMVATFLQDPVFKYEPTGPEDARGTALLEIIIQTQVIKAKMGLNLHTQWRDAFAYGLGVVAPFWNVINGHKRIKTVVNDAGIDQVKITREKAVLYEGNFLANIDPFLYLPDPMVAVQNVQDGRYVGWVSRENKMALLTEEFEDDGGLFNVRSLKFINGQSKYMTTSRERNDTAASNAGRAAYKTQMDSPVDIVTMYATIIPDDWNLGDSEKPEKWRFMIAGDTVIIAAQPLNLDHNMYPVSVAAPDYDGYSATPISRIEMSLGMQVIMDFLFNSHISNVRKAVNDTLIVDPSMINMNDLRSPEPGKIVRTRRSMWGKGVTGAVEQLKINDITKGNLGDIAMISGQIKEATGAVDSVSGQIRSGGERRSATEFRDARTGALAKLNKAARIMAMQSMQDLGFMFASQTQQLMSEKMKIRISGRWEEDLKIEFGGDKIKTVDPSDILVDTDLVVGSGNIPGGEPTELWIQLLQTASGNPEMLAQLNIPNIFIHIARQLGATNTIDFMRSLEIRPTEQVAQQAAAGEIVPIAQTE